MQAGRNLKFIVTLSDHRHLGVTFVPYLVEPLAAYYSIRTILRYPEIGNYDYDFNEAEKEVIRLSSKYADSRLSVKFSRNQNSAEFFGNIAPEYLKGQVLPYVWKQMYAITLLLMKNNIPLFEKEAKYANLYEEDIIEVPDKYGTAGFSFVRSDQGTSYSVSLSLDNEPVQLINRKVRIVVNDPCVLLVRNRLLVFPDMDAKKITPFLERDSISVAKNMEQKYFTNFIAHMVRDHDISASGFGVVHPEPGRKSVLSLEHNIRNHPVLILRFEYGGKELLVNDSREVIVNMVHEGDHYTFFKYKRDKEWEKGLVDFLVARGLREEAGGYTLPNAGLMTEQSAMYALVDWITAHHEAITSRGMSIRQVFFSKNYFTGELKMEFDLSQNTDWFDLQAVVQIGEYLFPFVKLKKYILNGIREFELPDGKIALLPEEWFESFRQLLQFGKVDGNGLLFDKHFFNLLRNKIPGQVPSVLDKLEKSLSTSHEVEVPSDLKATLRSYQVIGFQWIYSLVKNGMGGCLADDMGLGKTLQTIALLLKLRTSRRHPAGNTVLRQGKQLSLFDTVMQEEEQHSASLVVVPTSLVHNWVNEIRKFGPSLSIYIHAGASRFKNGGLKEAAASYDVIITTYGTLRNDREMFEKILFFIAILDESQYIKNKSSKIFDAVMALKSIHRLVLTGTPIENSLSDLWSQMNFLNQGLLGNYPFFRHNFQLPIESQAEEKQEERLQLLIRPFILRRTKDQVAKELPPVMESVLYCSMSEEQEKAYEREKSQIRNAIMASIEEKGVGHSSIVILQGLTRLRQMANHPSLVLDDENIESAKMNEIFLNLSNLIEENHKVLIFSSFVTHLELLRKRIEEQGWRYSLLTGKTRDREKVIGEYQEDPENRIFLISLKAGGVGLNLTSADYVFIIDPWWNPAAEMQAISRAHRIGQDKHVFVYRFITANTIEEKIQLLKERKSLLAEKFINSNNPFREISREEIAALFE